MGRCVYLHHSRCLNLRGNMNILKRIAITIVCFFAAIACYVFGIPAGGIAFFILGLIFEGFFLVRYAKKEIETVITI
jgi:hypothetical protein